MTEEEIYKKVCVEEGEEVSRITKYNRYWQIREILDKGIIRCDWCQLDLFFEKMHNYCRCKTLYHTACMRLRRVENVIANNDDACFVCPACESPYNMISNQKKYVKGAEHLTGLSIDCFFGMKTFLEKSIVVTLVLWLSMLFASNKCVPAQHEGNGNFTLQCDFNVVEVDSFGQLMLYCWGIALVVVAFSGVVSFLICCLCQCSSPCRLVREDIEKRRVRLLVSRNAISPLIAPM
jgi:hypothetical protein